MIPIPSGVRVWIATGHTDMRRGMQGLALTVQESLKRDPHAGERHAPQTPPPSSVDERITTALTDAAGPLPFSELRGLCRVRTASLYERLAALTTAGRIIKSAQGYRLTPS